MKKTGVVSDSHIQEIFINFETLLDIHEELSAALADQVHLERSTDNLPNLISVFMAASQEIARGYSVYCAKQANAKRQLDHLIEDPRFSQFLSVFFFEISWQNFDSFLNKECEQNVSLNKLGIKDLLVKPMHRITRYPLLFKRLLTYVHERNHSFEELKELIYTLDQTVTEVNRSVRQAEANYEIENLDVSLDFGSIIDVSPCFLFSY